MSDKGSVVLEAVRTLLERGVVARVGVMYMAGQEPFVFIALPGVRVEDVPVGEESSQPEAEE